MGFKKTTIDKLREGQAFVFNIDHKLDYYLRGKYNKATKRYHAVAYRKENHERYSWIDSHQLKGTTVYLITTSKNQETMTTIEQNKLIAEFMGWNNDGDFSVIPEGKMLPVFTENHARVSDQFEIEEMMFHSSWDWLMPVVEKIFTINFDENPRVREWSMQERGIFDPVQYGLHSSIESVFQACVQFIQWYNENK